MRAAAQANTGVVASGLRRLARASHLSICGWCDALGMRGSTIRSTAAYGPSSLTLRTQKRIVRSERVSGSRFSGATDQSPSSGGSLMDELGIWCASRAPKCASRSARAERRSTRGGAAAPAVGIGVGQRGGNSLEIRNTTRTRSFNYESCTSSSDQCAKPGPPMASGSFARAPGARRSLARAGPPRRSSVSAGWLRF